MGSPQSCNDDSNGGDGSEFFSEDDEGGESLIVDSLSRVFLSIIQNNIHHLNYKSIQNIHSLFPNIKSPNVYSADNF